MKQRILMAAAQEMNERGVKFTIDAIAARLGISKKTVYQYYESKDGLIAEMVQAAIDDIDAQEREILNSDRNFITKLTALLLVKPEIFGKINDWVYDDIRRFRPMEWEKVEQNHRAKLDMISGVLDEGIKGGFIRPINTRVAARMLTGICTELINYQFLQENNMTYQDAMEVSTDIFLHGVLSETKGR